MAQACDLCGKTFQRGNSVSHATNRRKRLFKPNLQRVHALVDGSRKYLRVCTQCLRSGRVVKVTRAPAAEVLD
jgi:large subunit ribosomal protein L28